MGRTPFRRGMLTLTVEKHAVEMGNVASAVAMRRTG
jgi:hypothetical protein